MAPKRTFRFFSILLLSFLISCKAYKQDILFQLSEDRSELSSSVYEAEKNYQIKPDDWLEVLLFYKNGEQLINPNYVEEGQGANNQFSQNRQRFSYLVQSDGNVKLPMIGTVHLAGLTIDEAERSLETAFDEIYKGSFLKISFANKRVTLLGALSTVVPLENENTSLLEVLAIAGGVQFGSQAQNVRVLRGDLDNPQVFEIDLTTVTGMKASMINIYPGDVIYVEPWRRPWLQVLRDISPVIGVTSSVSTLVFLLINSINNSQSANP